MAYSRRNKARKQSKKSVRKARRTRKTIAPLENACIMETLTFENIKVNTPYEAAFNLSQWTRATDMADNFQEYRIKKVMWKYTPYFDTYAAVSAGTLPSLYAKRILVDAPQAFGLPYLQALGAKPRRLDDKILNLSYKPNVSIFGSYVTQATTPPSTTPSQMPKYAPWLSTHTLNTLSTSPQLVNMDNTPHYGHVFYVQQDVPVATELTICSLECTAIFEFRKPWDKSTLSANNAQKTLLSVKV